MNILVPLAEGFEEIEAVTIIDILRRAGHTVTTASLKNKIVTGAHSIQITADKILTELRFEEFGAFILPGGMPGSTNLRDHDRVMSFIQRIYAAGGIIGAVCAAPIAIGRSGILDGKKFTCFPGDEKEITHSKFTNEDVTVDGKIITGRSAGVTALFTLKIIELIDGKEKAESLQKRMFIKGDF